jgi:hypothetical protein
MVAAPDEQPGQIQAVVSVQMREKDAHGSGVGVPLQRSKHSATEVDGEWWGVRRGDEVPRSRRIRSGDATGTPQYGDSHAHQLAMPDHRTTKTWAQLVPSVTK